MRAGRLLAAGLATGLATGLLLSGCTTAPDRASSSARRSAQPPQHGPQGRPGCRGVTRAQVRGPAISYAGDRPLSTTPVSGAVCAAYWLPGADRGLVPQGLALDGRTAWVGGYRFDPALGRNGGSNRCVLVRISLRTGRRLAGTDTVGGRPLCHHGGGLALTSDGLWVTGTVRLWLLDPDLVGTGRDPVRRSWRLVDPLHGSTLVARGDRLGLGRFDKRGRPSAISWFDRTRLLAPGARDLTAGPGGGGEDGRVAPVDRTPGLLWLQGAAAGPHGGLWLAQSVTRCGALRLPDGRRVAFVPGAEGIGLDRHGDLWALSESGARPYQRAGGRPLTPQLARYDTQALVRGPQPACDL